LVYDNSSLELAKYTPSVASEALNRDELQAVNYSQTKDDIERRKGRFKYICCDTAVQETSSGGCKKGKYGNEKSSKRNKTPTKDQIDQWEQLCMDNDEYNFLKTFFNNFFFKTKLRIHYVLFY
jgi:hypothetical protein